MTHFYDYATTSFFDTATHVPEQIPESALKITLTQKKQLLEGERTGSVIVINNEGKLVLKQPEPDPEIPARLERAWRDAEILKVGWLRDRHRDELDQALSTTLTTEQFSRLLAYIQLLRDWPEAEHFPATEYRPIGPDWLAQYIT